MARITVRSLFLVLALVAPAPLAAETPEEIRVKAEALLTEATQKAMRGEAGGAEGVDEALELYRSIEDRHGEALGLVVRSMAASSHGDYEPAIADLEAAISLLETAGDRLSAALFLWTMGLTERLDARYEAALAHLTRSAGLLASVAEDPRGASFRGFFSIARFFAGPSALPEQFLTVEAATPLLVSVFEAVVRDEMGGVLVDLERLGEAEEQLARAEAVSRLLGGILDMSLHAHLGDLRRRQWRLEEAKQHYERSLKGVGSLRLLPLPMDHRLDIQALGRLAEIESLLGRPEPALNRNTQALELARKDGDRAREASVLEDRGDLLFHHHRIQEAENTLEEALRVAKEAKDRYRQATILLSLGNLSFHRGAFEVAASRLEASRAVLRELGKARLEAPTNVLLAEVYLALESDESAASALAQAREAARKDDSLSIEGLVEWFEQMARLRRGGASLADTRAETAVLLQRLGSQFAPRELLDLQASFDVMLEFGKLTEKEGRPSDLELRAVSRATQSGIPQARLIASLYLANVALRQGRVEEARARSNAALHEARLLKNDEFEAYSLVMLSLVVFKEGKSREGLDLFRSAITSLERSAGEMQTDAILASFFGGARHRLYDMFISLLAKEGYSAEAFSLSERARARALLHQVGNRRVASAHTGEPALVAHADALRRAIAVWEDEKTYKAGVERTRLEQDIAHAKAEHEGLMTRIQVTNPEYASMVSVVPLTVPAIQQNLEPGQTLVSYFVIGERVHAWVLGRSGLRHVPLELGADGLEDVLCYSAELGRLAGSTGRGVGVLSGCPEDRARAARLYQRLFAPLAPSIQGNRLLLVPHGILHYLPFAALKDPGTGQFLVEHYILSYLPSASVLPFLRAKQSSFEGRALVLGAPAARDPELRPLAGAAREAQQVAKAWNTRSWLGAEAMESRLHGLAGTVDLIHLAAHGIYNSRRSSFTRIALAPGEGQDGNLEVHELLSEVDLTGVNLVVLSACETALGKRSAGDEVVSLARAILYAGSPAVISTLWRIHDDAAVELMTAFYGHLRGGRPAAEALRQAQLDLLRGERFREPWHWGAFALMGELTLQPQPGEPAPAAAPAVPRAPVEIHP